MFEQFFEEFLPKAVEYVADQGLNSFRNMKDFEQILENLHKSLKLLSAKAFDVEEEIKNAEVSGRKKRKREVKEWLEEVKSIKIEVDELESEVESEGVFMRFMDGGKAARLNEHVEKLLQQRLNFGESVLDVCGTSGETLLTNGMVGDTLHKDLERILKLLEDRKVSSVGVFGMGGVGKTTLAKHIHNRLLQKSEGRVFWITVSHEFTIARLQDKIARYLGVNLSDEDDEDIKAATLHRFLSQMKNSVLILDDVWEKIDMLKVGCTFSLECCRLIITTRSLEVCRQIHCQEVIQVVKLREDEAWKLFNETLGNTIEVGSEVEEIAKSMAKLCDGLPLGIITVAGSMRGEAVIHMWKNALAELKDCVAGGHDEIGEIDEVFKVLKYSFDRLNMIRHNHNYKLNTLQLCFMYCSLHPEDYAIRTPRLVRDFISEGLFDQRKSRRAQMHQGYSILDKLTNVCLLEKFIDSDGHDRVKMHDLVRGMALKVGKGKYMIRTGDYSVKEISNVEEWTEDLEKVSLMMNDIRRIEVFPNCPNLSTLLLRENFSLVVISDSFFSKMQGLCTLDLRRTPITTLPNSVSDLKSLKALLLEDCDKLETVPYLGKLKALRELNLSYTAIKEVPRGLEELLNLKFLSMNVCALKMLPRGFLLKLRHLQHLDFPFYIQAPMEEIENLKQLEQFSGGVKNVSDFNSLITSRTHDIYYRVRVGVGVGSDGTDYYRTRRGNFELNYNALSLCECNLNNEKVLGQGVVFLTIWKCKGMSKCFVDDLSRRLYNPASVKELRISRCGGIECILRCEQGLKSLEVIELVELEDLKGVVQIQKKEIGPAAPTHHVFSSLRQLIVHKCNKMRKLGLQVLGVPNLKEIRIEECGEIEEIFEDGGRGPVTLPKLKVLTLSGLPRLRKVRLQVSGIINLERIDIWECGELEEIFENGGGGFVTLPCLKELTLFGLPRLESVCEATMICNSINTIYVKRCPRLFKKLPLRMDDPPPPSLREIRVEREWWETLEWDFNPILPQLLHPFLQFF